MMEMIKKLYLNETEASERYGYSRQWFQRERWKRTGPKFLKINNGKILYPLEETDQWFANFSMQKNTIKCSRDDIRIQGQWTNTGDGCLLIFCTNKVHRISDYKVNDDYYLCNQEQINLSDLEEIIKNHLEKFK